MKRSSAVAVVAAFAPPPEASSADAGAVDALRRRLASGTAREHVVLDFLEDDLHEAHVALAGVAAWLADVERALADGEPSQQRLLSLALEKLPVGPLDELSSAAASVRRRLAQVAARI